MRYGPTTATSSASPICCGFFMSAREKSSSSRGASRSSSAGAAAGPPATCCTGSTRVGPSSAPPENRTTFPGKMKCGFVISGLYDQTLGQYHGLLRNRPDRSQSVSPGFTVYASVAGSALLAARADASGADPGGASPCSCAAALPSSSPG